jgi:hypothetical protein
VVCFAPRPRWDRGGGELSSEHIEYTHVAVVRRNLANMAAEESGENLQYDPHACVRSDEDVRDLVPFVLAGPNVAPQGGIQISHLVVGWSHVKVQDDMLHQTELEVHEELRDGELPRGQLKWAPARQL